MDTRFEDKTIKAILHHLDFHGLIKCRLVSPRWKRLVEELCSEKYRSLVLTKPGYLTSYWKYATTSDCFFGALRSVNFVQIAMNKIPFALDNDFTRLLLKLFRNIEHLVINFPPDSATTTKNLLSLIRRWENISALIIVMEMPRVNQTLVASAINKLKKLTKLDICKGFDTALLNQTLLQRIHYLTLTFEIDPNVLASCLGQVGPHCTRLWIEPQYCSIVTYYEIFSWMNSGNGNLFNRLTHFGCSSQFTTAALEFIEANFSSLKVWYIAKDFRGTFVTMGHVSRLKELRVLSAGDFYHFLTSAFAIRRMENVRSFELRVSRSNEIPDMTAVETFCRRLVRLLPNVEHLILLFREREIAEMIAEKRHMFKNLQTFKFSTS